MATEDILSTDDIAALVRQLRDDGSQIDDVASAPRRRYPAPRDIRRPERDALRRKFAAAAKSMEDALAADLETPIRVELVEVVPVSRRAFRDASSDLVIAPLVAPGAEALLALEASLALAIVDRTLGGSAADVPDRKALTPVERTLIDGILRRAVEGLFSEASFPPSGRFRVAESGARNGSEPAEAEAPATGVQFLFSVGGSLPPGEIRLFVPDPPLREGAGIVSPGGAPSAEEKRRIESALLKIPVRMTVQLGRARCGVEEVAGLAPGDVIALEAPREAPVVLRIGEKARLTARFGRQSGHFAVKIGRWLAAPKAPPAAPAAKPAAAPPTSTPTKRTD